MCLVFIPFRPLEIRVGLGHKVSHDLATKIIFFKGIYRFFQTSRQITDTELLKFGFPEWLVLNIMKWRGEVR